VPSPQASPPQIPSAKQEHVIPASAERHFHEAVRFERDGNAANAIEEYKAAIRDYPDYYAAHYNLGRLYLDKQGYSEAIAELRTAVSLRPDDANAHNNLGLALKHNRDLDGALQQYQEAVRLNPKMGNAQNNLANILYMKRDFNGAIQHYRAALALEPKDKDAEKLSPQVRSDLANTHTNLGSALDDAGKPEEAIAEYKEAIRLAPDDPKVHYNLSILYQNHKDVPAAVAELRQAAKLAPDWPTPHIMLARLLKDSDPKGALDQCIIADGLTQDAKLHDLCQELQKKSQ
jgi:tetratricopeptide (TPR) repeat protein